MLFLRGEEERGRLLAAARRADADADDSAPRRGGQGADAGDEGEVMGTVHRAGCDCRELHAALVRGSLTLTPTLTPALTLAPALTLTLTPNPYPNQALLPR